MKKEKRNTAKKETVTKLLNHKNSSSFWTAVKSLRPRESAPVPVKATEWNEFYSNLFQSQNSNHIITPKTVEDLDHEISIFEINQVLKKMKAKKAPGKDGIPNEVWKCLTPLAIHELTATFNNIYNTGVVPDEWALILLRPIFKKGDPALPQNYRPIALATTILKIFTTILSARLQNWSEKNGHFSPFQAGFRKKMETLEQIFCLLTLIQSKLRNPRGKLFAIFIDARMAFDSVRHDRLWTVLAKRGISSNFLKVLMSLYSKAKGQVLTPDGLTHSFDFQRGVLQGDPISSCLFNLFIDGISKRLIKSGIRSVKIGTANFHLLMFCDDIVIVANSAEDLQKKINVASQFFHDRGLQVNISKTKIVIFAKRKERKNLKFMWNQDEVEQVDSYTYLGVTFHRNGNFKFALKEFKEKATAAIYKVLSIIRKSGVPPLSTQFKLFNSICRSTLLYASPIWAMKHIDELDKIQLRFLKKLLRLPPTAPDYFVRLETGARDTRLQFLSDTIGFWGRICKKSDQSPVKQCMYEQLKWYKNNNTPIQAKFCWIHDFYSLLKTAKSTYFP
jgi:hypothetical protein